MLTDFYFYLASQVRETSPQPVASPTIEMTTKFMGQVDDISGNPISGATVRVDEITGKPPMQTTATSSSGFILDKISASSGERVRVYVSKDCYATNDRYVALPGPLPIVKLKRKK